jgi:hypothetical protein
MEALTAAIRDAWTRETSVDPHGWSDANPAWGQCAVTALLIQESEGGELIRAEVDGTSHYWNRLPSGIEVDLTREQFGDRQIRVGPIQVQSRDYVMSFPETRRRYEQLLGRLSEALRSQTVSRS